MARIPYADVDDPKNAAMVERVKRERQGRLPNLFKMLMNSPEMLEGYLDLFTRIRYKSTIDGQSGELAMSQVAALNGAEYEWRAHSRLALEQGMTQEQIDALPDWAARSSLFNDKQRAVLAYTDEMTRQVYVSDATFDALRPQFNNQQIVELTMTIAGYNLVSRFLEAMKIDME
ncbi:MAG: carboxymuconolactone decarboxylase family protein [Chloroflexi bacterium]|nr:carboxymuconolactone decarboxylase family protein [Chloroflexota bacterium]